ncbi:MAG: 4-(cytidine 5'-diphospho)-2-C-methyl-D-erythritol kinase [Desulfamplus sp.]|nr:4-(cytidine 5'-diphospho)-2-C-methyl-D-erythritol kinase [Desulfamplus sp.]
MLIKSPAKINLFLYVTGRRNNGYHDLFTLMSCIDLYDEIELSFNQPKTTVSCDNPDVPQDESNLVFKAVDLFKKAYFLFNKTRFSGKLLDKDSPYLMDKDSPTGLKIHIKKQIPVGAGLGGGSSNAASVLKAINCFYGFPFSLSELMKMGLQLGADVPFFIQEKAAIAEGIGEKLTPLEQFEEERCFIAERKDFISLPLMKSCYVLLFNPGITASTASVYKNLDLALTKPVKSNIKSLSKSSAILLKKSDMNQERNRIRALMHNESVMHNDLEESACTLYPEIGLFKNELIECVPEKVMMTGSGSTFFSLFPNREKAQRCFNELSIKWKSGKKKIFLTSLINTDSLM